MSLVRVGRDNRLLSAIVGRLGGAGRLLRQRTGYRPLLRDGSDETMPGPVLWSALHSVHLKGWPPRAYARLG